MALPGTSESPIPIAQAMIQTVTASADWVVILPVVLCLMGGGILLMFRNMRGVQAVFATLVVIAVIACDISLFARVVTSGPLTMTMGQWLPPFGISFTADALGALFALAGAAVTLVVMIYVSVEIAPREIRYGFYPLMLLLLGGVSGAFLTGDLFNLYVWFETMLIASFGLIIMGGRKVQLDGALKYGFINFLATTFFLIALGYLYGLLGTLNMADIALSAPSAPVGPMTTVAALFLLAFGMKAAVFPVNAWLPASYHTPAAAVSALFAGLLTKVGAYALIRTLVLLLPASRDALAPVITGLAVLTMVLAPMGAIAQTNLRRALGFFIIGGIGAIFAGLAMGSSRGIAGATLYVFHSILTMTALYLVAGLAERMTGATDTRQMGGVYSASSPLSILFLVLVFAVAGLPPFLGFWPKLMLVEAGIAQGDWLIVYVILANSFLTSIAGTRLWAHVFWRVGREGELSEVPNDRVRRLNGRETGFGLAPTAVLVAAILALGLWPNPLFETSRMAAQGLIDNAAYVKSVSPQRNAP
ncbi:MAG TPA: Na+/H+ antiporter subunit D [Devosiaceae bacterium]